MLSRDGDLLPVAKQNPFRDEATELYDQAISRYVLATAAEANQVGDEDCGPGSGLTGHIEHEYRSD